MVRMQTEVRRLLEAALDGTYVPVYYGYPQVWQSGGTVVSFIESENRCAQMAEPPNMEDAADAETDYPYEAVQRVVYTVDIWGATPEGNWDVFAKVNRAMAGFGFIRESSGDLYETQTRLHHRTSRYVAQIDLMQSEIC